MCSGPWQENHGLEIPMSKKEKSLCEGLSSAAYLQKADFMLFCCSCLSLWASVYLCRCLNAKSFMWLLS